MTDNLQTKMLVVTSVEADHARGYDVVTVESGIYDTLATGPRDKVLEIRFRTAIGKYKTTDRITVTLERTS